MKSRRSHHMLVPSLLIVATGTLHALDTSAVEIHGFVSQGYLQSAGNNFVADSEEGSFAYREVGLNVSSQVTDRLRVGAQIFAFDLGDFGNDELRLDWAFGDYRANDKLGLRVGRFKLPLGLYNEILDLDLAYTPVLLPQAVYDARYRDILSGLNGIQLYGTLPFGDSSGLDYQMYAGTSTLANDGYLALQFMEEGQGFSTVDSLSVGTVYGAQLTWRPGLMGLRILGSLLYAQDLSVEGSKAYAVPSPPLTFTMDLPMSAVVREFYIADVGVEYAASAWTLAAEYRLTYGDIDGTVDLSSLGAGQMTYQQEAHKDGGYLQVSYRLDDRWEIGTYYGVYFSNRNDRQGDSQVSQGRERWRAWQKDFAVTLRCDINENWNVKVEGHAINGTAMLSETENPDGLSENWFLFAAKTTISF